MMHSVLLSAQYVVLLLIYNAQSHIGISMHNILTAYHDYWQTRYSFKNISQTQKQKAPPFLSETLESNILTTGHSAPRRVSASTYNECGAIITMNGERDETLRSMNAARRSFAGSLANDVHHEIGREWDSSEINWLGRIF